ARAAGGHVRSAAAQARRVGGAARRRRQAAGAGGRRSHALRRAPARAHQPGLPRRRRQRPLRPAQSARPPLNPKTEPTFYFVSSAFPPACARRPETVGTPFAARAYMHAHATPLPPADPLAAALRAAEL